MVEDNPGLVWPSDILKEEIEKLNYKEMRIDLWLAHDVEDVTFNDEVRTQLKEYAPSISQIGPGLYRERKLPGLRGNTWGGLLVRALEEKRKDTRTRCLQYIYIWTKQKSVVSMVWMVWVPLLMGCWGLAVWWFYGPLIAASDLLLPSLATGFASLPLLLTCLYDHRADLLSLLRRESDLGLGFRSTTMLLPHSLMMWLVPFSHIWAWLIIGVAVISGAYWVLDQEGRVGTSHPMDYLPVFVWIKSEGLKPWEFDKAYWDKFHYHAECRKKDELREKDFVQDKFRKKGVRLQMDNPWHSVRAGGHMAFRLWFLSFLCVPVILVALYYIVEAGRFTEWPNDGFMFILLLFVFVAASRTAVRFPSQLVTEDDLEFLKLPISKVQLTLSSKETKNHLSRERLKVLWNLVLKKKSEEKKVEEPEKLDVRPRLVVITKLQDPFNFYNHDQYYDNFRDNLEYLYMYMNHRCRYEPEHRTSLALVKEVIQTKVPRYTPQQMLELERTVQAKILDKVPIDKTAIETLVEKKLAEKQR